MSGEVIKKEYWIGHHTDGDAFILDKPKSNWQPQKHVINAEYVEAIESDNKAMKLALDRIDKFTIDPTDKWVDENFQYAGARQFIKDRCKETLSNLRGKYE